MIRHLFRLTWNRRRSTSLVFLELVGCFLVLCAVSTGIAYTVDNWRQPLGFQWQDTWRVRIGYGPAYRSTAEERRESIAGMQRVLSELRSMPDIEVLGAMDNGPYIDDTSSTIFELYGREADVQWASITETLPRALGLGLRHGRWFEPADAALDWIPVVISENLARARFGDADPLGQPLVRRPDAPEDDGAKAFRVVGVMQDFRRFGETTTAPYMMFTSTHLRPEKPMESDLPPSDLIVRTRPGTGAGFEADLVRQLHGIAPTWSLDAEPLEQARSRWLRNRLVPLVLAGTLGGFLLLMVGFGLVGVLWQNVARRTSEIGLRRALGATAGNVRTQIVGEMLAATTLAVGVGMILFLNLPTLGVFDFLSWRIYLLGLTGAALVLYAFVVVCALYPGWMATRIHPARALQHE